MDSISVASWDYMVFFNISKKDNYKLLSLLCTVLEINVHKYT